MKIKCVFKHEKWQMTVNASKTVYFCFVNSCNITDRGSTVASFNGVHKAGQDNNTVKGLWFENTKVHYIPRNLKDLFPKLVYLYVGECELKEISSEDLVGLKELEDLDLPGNKITTLPVDLFKSMKNLQEASFSENLIQDFDVKVLEPIKDTIKFFEILKNPGIDEFFSQEEADVDDFIERLELRQSKKIESQRFEEYFRSGKYSDFTIKLPNKEFKVHKIIFASLSSVFKKMFDFAGVTSKTFDNTGNFSEGTIEEFVRFFYNKTAPSKENVSEVLKLAIEFDVPDLKMHCEATLVQSIDPESSRQLYNLAVQNSLPNLMRKSFEAIQQSHPEIMDYIYDEPDLVNRLIDKKDESQAKKMKLEKD